MAEKQGKQNLLPTIFVVLGATGDLMRRKLTPGLFHLYKTGHLPSLFQVIGFSKDAYTQESFREMVAGIVKEKVRGADPAGIEQFRRFFVYQQGLFEENEGYQNMATFLGQKDGEWKVCANKLFYIAASPQFYETIFRKLASSGLTKPCSPEEGWTRVIVEKPFGKDLQTAQKLDELLGKLFREEQIYRIDHYLGKETVQNILAFRFSNSFLQDSWNKTAMESIHIQFLERDPIGERGGFYDGIGALRDVGQNHALQLLALFTMENPGRFDGDALRLEGSGMERQFCRAEFRAFRTALGELLQRLDAVQMLRLQSRFCAAFPDADGVERLLGEHGERQCRAYDLPAPFPITAVNLHHDGVKKHQI
ncbi:MAG: Glucose-6-phosphate 1-dehydrogenase [Parcubacteria group bacterium GW2011_GWF1_40_5]|nr:MAG: Glucose-6-phosphate 1-dehydrogenase [Parcubacteria group bacterium GW2011_GWF1_40_5]